jgi:hypothetical protein
LTGDRRRHQLSVPLAWSLLAKSVSTEVAWRLLGVHGMAQIETGETEGDRR